MRHAHRRGPGHRPGFDFAPELSTRCRFVAAVGVRLVLARYNPRWACSETAAPRTASNEHGVSVHTVRPSDNFTLAPAGSVEMCTRTSSSVASPSAAPAACTLGAGAAAATLVSAASAARPPAFCDAASRPSAAKRPVAAYTPAAANNAPAASAAANAWRRAGVAESNAISALTDCDGAAGSGASDGREISPLAGVDEATPRSAGAVPLPLIEKRKGSFGISGVSSSARAMSRICWKRSLRSLRSVWNTTFSSSALTFTRGFTSRSAGTCLLACFDSTDMKLSPSNGTRPVSNS